VVADPGAIHQYIQPAEVFERGGHCVNALLVIAHIHDRAQNFSAFSLEVIGGFLNSLRFPVGDQQADSFFQEHLGATPTQSRSASRYQCDFIVEIEIQCGLFGDGLGTDPEL
jgi:hypothetical protein